MSRTDEHGFGSALVLGAGLGMLAAQVIAVGGVLVADWWVGRMAS